MPHTPGPWRACDDPAPDRALDKVIRSADGWSLAYLPGVGPTREPNARLIAAAPELLAAAELAERYMTSDLEVEYQVRSGTSEDQEYLNRFQSDLDALRATIRRARGKE